jgi:hypothetical protein
MEKFSPKQKNSVQKLTNFFLSRFYFLTYIPSLFFWGVKIKTLNEDRCIVSIPYNWMTKNPFQSMYFAAQAGAAELSTGLAALLATEGRNVSMLVIGMQGNYTKKARTACTFHCEDLPLIFKLVEETIESGEAQTAIIRSIGKDKDGDTVSTFEFTWSFKSRKAK